jgi:hypothetical protein
MIRVHLVGAAAFALLSACAHAPSAETAARPGMAAQASGQASDMMAICPMQVPDTTVSATDTLDGEALTFTTSSGQVAELRRRVRAMADMHNQHHASATTTMQGGTGHGGMMGGAAMGHGEMMPPPSRAAVQDVDDGARIVVAPNEPAQAAHLRSAVRLHAQHMQREGCGMMMGGPDR